MNLTSHDQARPGLQNSIEAVTERRKLNKKNFFQRPLPGI